jgi:CBS domain containing-hemolysin-like protein
MISFILGLVLAAVMYVFITLEKTYNHVTAKELKRQAADGDELAKLLYRAVAHGQNLRLFTWAGTVLSAAASTLLFANAAPGIFGFILIVLLLVMGFLWLPSRPLTTFSSHLAIWATPAVDKFLYYFHRPLHFVSTKLGKEEIRHTKLYAPEDLIEFLGRQKRQANNRILHDDLAAAELALKFNDKTVSSVMLSGKEVKLVSESEKIAPKLIDELHKSGQTEYPVYKSAKTNIVGLVRLRDLVASMDSGGKMSDVTREDLAYVHEDFTLGQVLAAFNKTGQTAFIVINSKERYQGLVTLKSVLAELAAPLAKSNFAAYEDKTSVAHAMDATATDKAT